MRLVQLTWWPRKKELIAIEIETGEADAVWNLRKCLRKGFDKVVVAILDQKLKGKVEDLLKPEELKK